MQYIPCDVNRNVASPDDVSVDDDHVESRGVVKIEVTDSGAGISAENCSKLFKSIVQFNAGQLQGGGGTGLGLFMSKKIVDLHDGQLSVSSAGEGLGTTFTLILPAYKSFVITNSPGLAATEVEETGALASQAADIPLNDVPSLESLGAQALPVSAVPKPSVLVVDDVAMTRKMLRKLLQSRVRMCLEAEDGIAAVEQITRAMASGGEEIDVVMMDNNMPRMTGPDACSRMRELGFTGLIIGVTGNVLPADIEMYLSRGANRVLTKPFDIEEFDRLWREKYESAAIYASSRGF